MEIKDIEKALSDAQRAPNDAALVTKYCDCVAAYFEKNKSTDEVVSIVIRGIDLDRAANYFDYLERSQEKELKTIWKQIDRQSKKLIEEQADLVLKFLSGLLWMSFMKAGKMEILCGNIVTVLVGTILNEKKPVSDQTYGQILRDYLLDDLDPRKALPQWDSIEASAEDCQRFAQIILNVTDGENAGKYKLFRLWAERGLRYTQEQIKKKKIEEKIPKSRIADLTAIVEDYKAVEKQLREQVYQIAKMQEEISTLYGEKSELERQVRELTEELTAKQQQLDKAEKEVNELTEIIELFDENKKQDERALLTGISDALKEGYRDFVKSESLKIDKVPSEVYKEKLKNIYKILRRKGIKME